MIIGVIGAGASGLISAITASENIRNDILIFERQARVGKKLQVTGNGRCNLSNYNLSEKNYHGNDPSFSSYALKNFSPVDTITWFRNHGLFTTVESSGRVYPYTDQANSVTDILRFGIEKNNIHLYTDTEIKKAYKSGNKFILKSDTDTFKCDKLIIACGGAAGTKYGGCRSGYSLLESFGHTSTKLHPSLVQIKTGWQGVKALKGVRANCTASIFYNNAKQITSTGEIQFTDYGMSGPVIFEISRDVCTKPGKWECVIDFLPDNNKNELYSEIVRRKSTELTAENILTGIVHNKIGRVLCKEADISLTTSVCMIPDAQINMLCDTVKNFKINLTSPMGMDYAQVTAGGILTDEFNAKTMESKLVNGLYACGEVLDIDGDCGGYNLQWAWSSGKLAGQNAGKE